MIRIFNDWKCDVNWKARHATATSSAIWPIPFNHSTTHYYREGEKFEKLLREFPVTSVLTEAASFWAGERWLQSTEIQVTNSYFLMIPSCAIRNRFPFHREKLNWKIPTGGTWYFVSQTLSTTMRSTTKTKTLFKPRPEEWKFGFSVVIPCICRDIPLFNPIFISSPT